MITKGNLHASGAKLASYLKDGLEDERAELIEQRGIEMFGPDPVKAFDTLQQVATAATRSTKPFFHTQARNASGERLTPEQWLQVADRQEELLGFQGQPRLISLHHQEDGATHMHVAWFRVDLDTMRAIDPGMYKNKLKKLSRTLEKELGLQIVSNERAADDKTRAPGRGEFEEARRLKTDLRAIRNTILECFQHSDCGLAMQAALTDHSFMLARGDRRDCFVVVDHQGGQHALNKRLTGSTLADIRDRFADLDRYQLPTVDDVKREQAYRREQGQTQSEHVDRDAADAQWFEQVAAAGIEKSREEQRAAEKAAWLLEQRTWRDMNAAPTPLENKIIDALDATMTGVEFAMQLDRAGITIARTTAEDEKALHALRADAALAATAARTEGVRNVDESARHFGKVVEGDFAAVTRIGDVIRLNPTALDFEEVQQRLNDVQASLPSITAVRAINQAEREQVAEDWKLRREYNTARATARHDGRANEQVVRHAAQTMRHGVQRSIAATAGAGNRGLKGARSLLAGASKVAEGLIGAMGSLFGGDQPRLTPQQIKDIDRAETSHETLHARQVEGLHRASHVEHAWRLHAMKTKQQEKDLRLAQFNGRPQTAEAQLGFDEYEPQRAREREGRSL